VPRNDGHGRHGSAAGSTAAGGSTRTGGSTATGGPVGEGALVAQAVARAKLKRGWQHPNGGTTPRLVRPSFWPAAYQATQGDSG